MMLRANQQLNSQIQIANAWLSKGKFRHAEMLYKRAIATDSQALHAYIGLGRIKLYKGQLQESLVYLDQALNIDPDDCQLQIFYDSVYSKQLQHEDPLQHAAVEQRINVPPNAPRNIRLGSGLIPSHYPQGWFYALQALKPLLSPQGVLLDSYVDQSILFSNTVGTFGGRSQQRDSAERSTKLLDVLKENGTFSELATAEEQGTVPYREPWVGIVHTPPKVPTAVEHYAPYRLQNLVEHHAWQQSIAHCVGLFTLSEYLANWLRQQTGLPVSVLRHPTRPAAIQFEFQQFRQNREKKIIQIGWWLRRINSIYELPLAQGNSLGYTKIRLLPKHHQRTIEGLIRRERQRLVQVGDAAFYQNTQEVTFVTDAIYNTMLSENVLFLDVYDSSAMNIIVECIARATPLLINPLPAVIEYLGVDYPFYFESLPEAARKAVDLTLIEETHAYLKQCPMRTQLDGQTFFEGVLNSEVYRLIK